MGMQLMDDAEGATASVGAGTEHKRGHEEADEFSRSDVGQHDVAGRSGRQALEAGHVDGALGKAQMAQHRRGDAHPMVR